MSDEFKVGDVVYLKSGSPPMTVTAAGEGHMTGEAFVACVWFDSKHAQQKGTFPPGALEKGE